MEIMHSVSALKLFRSYSFEEIRLGDYKRGLVMMRPLQRSFVYGIPGYVRGSGGKLSLLTLYCHLDRCTIYVLCLCELDAYRV
ncbi:hypothetical protein BDW62DRAFT_87592 [Aspergillus aurantiobrunneus]